MTDKEASKQARASTSLSTFYLSTNEGTNRCSRVLKLSLSMHGFLSLGSLSPSLYRSLALGNPVWKREKEFVSKVNDLS